VHSHQGTKLLKIAAASGRADFVEWLCGELHCSAVPDRIGDDDMCRIPSALHAAMCGGESNRTTDAHFAVVKLLVEKYRAMAVFVQQCKPTYGPKVIANSLITAAASGGNIDIFRYLTSNSLFPLSMERVRAWEVDEFSWVTLTLERCRAVGPTCVLRRVCKWSCGVGEMDIDCMAAPREH
jgi:hypothetical protein